MRTSGMSVAVALTVGLLLLVGAYALGGTVGDNSDAVGAEAKRGYKQGFDNGRRRSYQAAYKSARSRVEQAASEGQANAAPLPTAATPEGTGESDLAPDSAADDGTENCNRSGLGFDVGDCPTDEEIEAIGVAEDICGSPASVAEKRAEAERRTGDPDLCGE